ncbi:MAG: alpha-amylase family glycosyl hydrolase, partial [Bacteroidota bacterium]
MSRSQARVESIHHSSVVIIMLAAAIGVVLSQTTVLAADRSSVPSWAKKAIWYQVFPERFRNGDPKNDPTVVDIRGSWPHEEPQRWQVSPWTADWYKLQPWETIDNKGFYFRAQQRRYGGDLQGVLDKLDYLKELGINAL